MNTAYRPEYLPTTRDIHDVFTEEIESLGGVVADVFDDGVRLFARAVLTSDAQVRPDDAIRAGVAVRATTNEIAVHPYTFRLVCTNGAIATHSFQSRSVERLQSTEVFLPAYDIAMRLNDLREAVRTSGSADAFDAATSEMRSAAQSPADTALQLLPALARLPQHMVAHVLPMIFGRFADGSDRSAFGLLNAVTSVARDIDDPETRWCLEEVGGTMPCRLERQPVVAPRATAATT